jgi:protein-L-isoaspartate(D-aspartate) O-methyltransferase
MPDYTVARLNMVEGQIKPNRVTDGALLDAFLEVPRELFVPKAMRGIAYVDEDIRIAGNRWLMEPMVLGRLLQESGIGPDDVVLDVGCGSGYSTAVIARLCNTVVAVESDPDLAHQATQLLAQLGVDNAVVMEGPPAEGHREQAPYQAIIINGAVAEVPEALTAQIAEGGRLGAVIRPGSGMGKATLFLRLGDTLARRELFDAATPYLPGLEPRPAFQF